MISNSKNFKRKPRKSKKNLLNGFSKEWIPPILVNLRKKERKFMPNISKSIKK